MPENSFADNTFAEKLQQLHFPAWELLPDFGLYMDQLVTYIEKCCPGLAAPGQHLMTPAMINNYVKDGLVDRPAGKKYSRDCLGQLLMLTLLKSSSSMETLKKLLHPASGVSTQELYGAFRQTQEQITKVFARNVETDAVACALKACSYQLLCRLLLEETET